MRTRKLIKTFLWRNQDRDDVVLGADTRLDSSKHRATLLADSNGAYPTAADLYVKSRLTEPRAVRSWIGFEADVRHVRDPDNPSVVLTSAAFRLNDGTADRFWDGGAWTVAGASDWNTEQEVADNVAAWDVNALGKKLRVVVNLETTDARFTPELVSVKVLWEAALDSFQEDMIFRSFVRALRSGVRPIANAVVAMPATGTTIAISALALETGYNVVGVDAVFDFDADSDACKEGTAPDLLLAYAAPTITLNAPVTQGTNLWVRFVYEPEVAVHTSQDFIEQAKVPAIVLTDIAIADCAEAPAAHDSVANKGAGTAIVVPSPLQGNLEITLLGMTEKGVDHQRLSEEINAFLQRTPFIVSTGIDERYRLHVIDEYEAVGDPGQNETHTGQARLRIYNFRQWLRPAFDDYIAARAPTFNVQT